MICIAVLGLCFVVIATLGIGLIMAIWKLWWVWLLCLCGWLLLVCAIELLLMLPFAMGITKDKKQLALLTTYYTVVSIIVWFVVVLFLGTSKDVDLYLKLRQNHIKDADISQIKDGGYVFEWKTGFISTAITGSTIESKAFPLVSAPKEPFSIGGFVVCDGEKGDCFENVAYANKMKSLVGFVSVKRDILGRDDTDSVYNLIWKLKANDSLDIIESDDDLNFLTIEAFEQLVFDVTFKFVLLMCLMLAIISTAFLCTTGAVILLNVRHRIIVPSLFERRRREFYEEL